MNLRLKTILVLALFLLTANGQRSMVFAASHLKAGTNSGNVLEIKPGARPAAMGHAFVGVADDINAVNYNPAGLALLTKNELQFNQNNLFDGVIASNISFILQFSDMQAENIKDFGVLGGGVTFVDYGRLDGRDALGQDTGEFGSMDRLVSVSYGKAFNSVFSFGITGREVRQEIYGIKANGFSFDGGVMFSHVIDNVNIGLAAQNLGEKISFEKEEEALPTNFALGTSLMLVKDRLLLAADLNKPVNNYYYWNLGTEYWLTQVLTLRLGYSTKHDIGNGISSGVGINLREFDFSFLPVSELSLNYGYLPHGDLGFEHRMDLVLKIGVE